MLGGYQICPLAAIRKAPQVITDGSQTPGSAAPGLPPNADYLWVCGLEHARGVEYRSASSGRPQHGRAIGRPLGVMATRTTP